MILLMDRGINRAITDMGVDMSRTIIHGKKQMDEYTLSPEAELTDLVRRADNHKTVTVIINSLHELVYTHLRYNERVTKGIPNGIVGEIRKLSEETLIPLLVSLEGLYNVRFILLDRVVKRKNDAETSKYIEDMEYTSYLENISNNKLRGTDVVSYY